MSSTRMDLLIDVDKFVGQHARALVTLTGEQLVSEVIGEFKNELEYLGNDPKNYALVRANGNALKPSEVIAKQIRPKERLRLTEVSLRQSQVPNTTKKPSQAIYMREIGAEKVHKIHWMPAVIGRRDRNMSRNDLVAVDLAGHAKGLQVSRHHVKISEKQGAFYVECLKPYNPVTLIAKTGEKTPLDNGSHPLQNGDMIRLHHSNITLKFIARAVPTQE